MLEGLERHKLLKFFLLKTVHDTKPKPEPDMGLEIISEMKVIKTNVLMIGDTINDALMSKIVILNSLVLIGGSMIKKH